MQCREVEAVLEQQGFVPVPEKARAHLAGCNSCQSLVADLTAIVATAHLFPAEVEPPARVWSSLRHQLEAEGIIKSASRQPWWHGFSTLFRARAFAVVSVVALAAIAVTLQFQQPSQRSPEVRNVYPDTLTDTSSILSRDEASLPAMHLASNGNVVNISLRRNLDIVDTFIVDCEQRVKEQPEDQLAREYLSGAYQQKAELISAMMERGETEY
jgi:hypothetical protein